MKELIPYRKGLKWGFCDSRKNLLIPLKYEEVELFSEGLAGVKFNDKWGFVDETGREVIPVKYDEVLGFGEGLAGVSLDGK